VFVILFQRKKLFLFLLNGTANFFAFSLIIEGTTEKVLQFKMLLKAICNRNFGFIEQTKLFLKTTESFKQEKLYELTSFSPQNISVDLFRVAPYMLMLLLHKDALFHWVLSLARCQCLS
jgi:hypothetical protein